VRRPRNLGARLESIRARLPGREKTDAEAIADFLIAQEAGENRGEVVAKGSPGYRALVEEVRAFILSEGGDPDEPISNFDSKP
jgi:hypothetical protein